MSRKPSHSRYLDYSATDIGNRAYWRAKQTPTARQVKFYKQLYALCKKNDIDTSTGEYTRTRADYAMAIDKLLERLREAGIDVQGNGKEASYVLKVGEDRRRRLYVGERIEVKEEESS